jgi:hypothetical protein
VASAGKTTSFYATYIFTNTWTIAVADIYTTLCDGIPRAHGSGPISHTLSHPTTTFYNYTDTVYSSTFTGTKPSCSINPSDCGSLVSSYRQETSAFDSFTSSYTPPFFVTSTPLGPSCSATESVPAGCTTCCKSCTVAGDHVQLLYWPVTTTGGNVCGKNGTTISPTDTAPRTTVFEGMTLVSPTVYISFHQLSARDDCGRLLGDQINGTILAMQPDQVSSARGGHLRRYPYSFNYADLDGPVSKEAYCQMIRFDWSPCQTIYDDDYEPFLWIPSQVASMRPEWSTCAQAIYGIYDPPHALSTAAALTPVDEPKTTKETAKPAPTASRNDPPVTALPNSQSTVAFTPKGTEGSTPQAIPNPGGAIGSLLFGPQDTAGPVDIPNQTGGFVDIPNPTGDPADIPNPTGEGGVAVAIASALGLARPSQGDDGNTYSKTFITIGSHVLPISSSKGNVVVDGQTLNSKNTEVVVGGQTMSLDPSGNLMAGASTVAMSSAIAKVATSGTGTAGGGSGGIVLTSDGTITSKTTTIMSTEEGLSTASNSVSTVTKSAGDRLQMHFIAIFGLTLLGVFFPVLM